MSERKISFANVKDTIEMPDYVLSRENKTESYRRISGKMLKVVHANEDTFINIITLMWK
jgi:hypothetical protein